MPEETQKAFISYAREDAEFALRLAKDLRSAGADVWVDQLDIPPGKHWDLAVPEAVERCPRMLVILSPASVASKNVMDEVSFALEQEREVIPVMYRECKVPFRLRRMQYVDFTEEYGGGLARLLDSFGVQQSGPPSSPGIPSSNDPQRSELTHVELLKKAITEGDLSVWNRWRVENPDTSPDLSGADLRGADLGGADLRGADLSRADLSGTDLSRANLYWSILSGANLGGANFCFSNLFGADLRGANLTRADLRGADLSRANLYWSILSGANLARANFYFSNLFGADISGADLRGATGLSQEQIDAANGDPSTSLPDRFPRPDHWKK